jgi:hypothetical protein
VWQPRPQGTIRARTFRLLIGPDLRAGGCIENFQSCQFIAALGLFFPSAWSCCTAILKPARRGTSSQFSQLINQVQRWSRERATAMIGNSRSEQLALFFQPKEIRLEEQMADSGRVRNSRRVVYNCLRGRGPESWGF